VPFNASFLTLENIRWWHHVSINYSIPFNKEIMFLPCAGGHKTRDKIRTKLENGFEISYRDPRKFISESMTHNCMKAIRECNNFEKIILSEPLTIIPYSLEQDSLRPDYNLPVDFLSVQGEFIFIDRLSQFLLKIKYSQPWRENIFYFGNSHHYLILYYANLLTQNILTKPAFNIIAKLPAGGSRSYSKEAEIFIQEIDQMFSSHTFTQTIIPNLSHELKKRGRYSHKPFIESLNEIQWTGKSRNDNSTLNNNIKITDENRYKEGFLALYDPIRGLIK
jgi:hypothetical protein